MADRIYNMHKSAGKLKNSVKSKILVSIFSLTLVTGIVSCSADPVKVLAPKQPVREKIEPADKTASYQPGASAKENEAFFARVTKEYSEGPAPIEGVPLVDTYAGRGFVKEDMQVSFDTSKLDLPADSLFLAVRIGEECLIAQFEREDRSYQTKRVSTVGPNKDKCLIGNTRSIDW